MKKTIKTGSSLLLCLLLLGGCLSRPYDLPLMTKEELFTYIEENQWRDTVDITVEDLESVDVDDFIKRNVLSRDGRKYR